MRGTYGKAKVGPQLGTGLRWGENKWSRTQVFELDQLVFEFYFGSY